MGGAPGSSRPRLAWAIALLVGTCALVFGRVATFEFVWDDKNLIASNPFLRQTDTLWRAFTHGFWDLSPVGSDAIASSFYRPVVVVGYWVQLRVFDGSPAGFHLVNLALHVGCTVLLLRIGVRLGLSTVAAALGAALFAVHPVQVVAVANIASQTDLWATLGVLAGALVWCRQDRRRWAALPLLLFALLAKESAIVGPALAVALAWVVHGGPGGGGAWTWRGALRALAPFAVIAPYAAMRLAAIDGVLSGQAAGATTRGGALYVHYVARVLVPVPEPPIVAPSTPSVAMMAGSLLALVGAAILLARPGRPARVRLAGGWFLVGLLPVAELVPLGARQNDLLLYLPLGGIALALAHVVDPRPRGRVIAAVAIAGCAVVSAIRLGVWRDSLTLWEHGVRLDPEHPAMRMNYANALRAGGEPAEGCAQLRVVLEHLQARPMQDVEVRTHYNLGNCARQQGDLPGAAAAYRRAFELSGRALRPAAHNLAIVLVDLARYDEAIAIASELIALDDSVAPSWQVLGVAYLRKGRLADAEAALTKAATLDPRDPHTRRLLDEARRR